MNRRAFHAKYRLLVASSALFGVAAASTAQTADPRRDVDRSLQPAPALAPVGSNAGARGDSGAMMSGGGVLVREGAYLRNRRGRLVKGEGDWVYVFDADASGQAEPPMVMVPCRRLREMQQTLDARTEAVSFLTTGQVLVYKGRNHFLPTFFSVYSAEVPPAPATTEPQGGSAGASEGAAESRDPSAEDVLRGISGPARRPSGLSRALTSSSVSEPLAPLREGLVMTSRRGRVTNEGARLVFTIDGGADKPSGVDPPLILVPCLNTESIERLVGRAGKGPVFVMSGRVLAYEGRNYLIPTLFVVEQDREGNVMPAQ